MKSENFSDKNNAMATFARNHNDKKQKYRIRIKVEKRIETRKTKTTTHFFERHNVRMFQFEHQ